MRVSDLQKASAEKHLQVLSDSVRVRWSSSYYDGPLEGIAEFHGKVCWFHLAEENPLDDEHTWFRKLWLIDLNEDQIRFVNEMHSSFVANVGDHFDHKENGLRKRGYPKPREQWAAFYDTYHQDSMSMESLAGNQILGWFYWPDWDGQQGVQSDAFGACKL